jgi:hypothetical protein
MLAFLLFALTSLAVIRQLALLGSAEKGRKRDLVKHIYRSGNDFNLSVVIPVLQPSQVKELGELLTGLAKQDYPAKNIQINVVSTPTSFLALEQLDLTGVTVWNHPQETATKSHLQGWIIERLLAQEGPSRLFVFLDADDMIRPDFMRNVTSRAFDCFVMQGYVAFKRPPQEMVSKLFALATRLNNRIENAGRYHAGFSSVLQGSGWVIRQELLEMLPFTEHGCWDNLEYTVLLHLNNYRVHWAPNVVVYKNENVSFHDLMSAATQTLFNRARLIIRYAGALVFNGISRQRATSFFLALDTLKIPAMIWLTLLSTALFALPTVSSRLIVAGAIVLWLTVQLLQSMVARCKIQDVLAAALQNIGVYPLALLSFPYFAGLHLLNRIMNDQPSKSRMGKRFDETKPSRRLLSHETLVSSEKPSQDVLESFSAFEPEQDHFQVELSNALSGESFATIFQEKLAVPFPGFPRHTGLPQDVLNQPIDLPITNGINTVISQIEVIRQVGLYDTTYHLKFQYKQLHFETKAYSLLDQAYYELLSKLNSKGFNVVSCGSCAYYNRPNPEQHATLPDYLGVCLFGRNGQQPEPETDSASVVTPACEEHLPLDQRETVREGWLNSMHQTILL